MSHQRAASVPLWVTQLLNVLPASYVNVYAFAVVLEEDVSSTCCNKDDVMWHVSVADPEIWNRGGGLGSEVRKFF